ncbi:caspase-1-like [Micropterus salmoides]|uniref:caspase-1-like n=1 Tax=Micropterus salmoides TaxID=27706 RepID=UPI0018EAC773|nr:caspase-1-like [Micropterus salmoides]
MAEQELFNVRSKFVEKASKELINQLLDDILGDRIVNVGEKDSIIEENQSKADRARCLIDTVRNKGNDASRKLIAHIQIRDPALYSTLGLSSGQPAPPETPVEQKWSETVIKTTEEFWIEKQKDKDVYPAAKSSIRNRVALLITNIKFTDKKWNRSGAETDEKNMEKLLTCLGYEVVKHTNLTGKAIDDSIIKFSKLPKLKETDSVAVVIMSHGKQDVVIGVNHTETSSDEFPINNIYTHLGSKECPALLDKPKIIIIQACRGGEEGSVLVIDSANSALDCDDVNQPGSFLFAGGENIEDDALRLAHKEKDFISLLSCTPDTVSYRHTCSGSLVIQFVVKVFNTFACENDIEELFRKVLQSFEAFPLQMPTKDRCTLLKRFYFFPGI